VSARVLADRYELRERLGSGGMAEVYRGEDRVLGREVAAKILHPRFARDPQYVARFRREARAAAGITHPHVVAVFDTGEDEGTRYIVMQYVRGRTLKDLIGEEAPLPPEGAVEIATAVCDGVAAAHARGLVHRDIKPANIMLTEDGGAKVMDFGIARATTSDTITATAVVMGTAAYLSPEQARGEPVDARSDLYSLGCVLYEMLCGSPPFTGEHAVAVAARHVRDAPEPLAARNPDVPDDLAAVVMRCLEKDPDRRFQSAEALRAAMTGGGAPAPTVSVTPAGGDTAVLPAQEAPEQAPDRPRLRFLALLAALALVGFLGATAYRVLTGSTPGQEGAGTVQEGAPGQDDPAGPGDVDLTPEQAYLALAGVVEEGLAEDEITEKAAEEVLKQAREAVREHADGDLEEALDEVADLRDEVLDLTPGEITEPRAGAILEAAGVLEASIRQHPPPEPAQVDEDTDEGAGGDGDPGRGHGRDRGGGPPGGTPPGQS
jgi:eukaryotic-like serine/threonine-protein kinase